MIFYKKRGKKRFRCATVVLRDTDLRSQFEVETHRNKKRRGGHRRQHRQPSNGANDDRLELTANQSYDFICENITKKANKNAKRGSGDKRQSFETSMRKTESRYNGNL